MGLSPVGSVEEKHLRFFVFCIGHDWTLLSFEDRLLSTFTYSILNLETDALICNLPPFNWKNSHQLKVKGNKVKCKENQTSTIIYKYIWHHHSIEGTLNSTTPTSVSWRGLSTIHIPSSGWLKTKAPWSQHESYWCITVHVKNVFILCMQPVKNPKRQLSYSGIQSP